MAKTTGVLRGFDKAGRFVIPAEMVRTLELEVDDFLEISYDGTTIYLRKHQPFCVFCGEQDEKLVSFKNKNICQSCAAEITSEFVNMFIPRKRYCDETSCFSCHCQSCH